MENEFGEEVSENTISKLGERISKLEAEMIDQLFYEIGFIVEKDEEGRLRGDKYKALPENKIKEIKEKGGDSPMIRNLLLESKINTVKEALDELENRE